MLAVAQAFKGTLSVAAVARAFSRAIRDVGAEGRVLAGSDGGDGLLEALEPLVSCQTLHETSGPLGRPLRVSAGWLDQSTAVVESRLACGLALLAQRERDPLRTTTRGVGTVLESVVEAGARTVYLGLGGSATMDGGVGMARVWGWIPRDADGAVLDDGGGALASLASLVPGSRPRARIVGLADVTSPLLGREGALRFASQKGADARGAHQLSLGLERLVQASAPWGGPEFAGVPGAGAAGGLGFGVLCFAGGTLRAGAPWVLHRLGFADALSRADLVLTGEGAFDGTSLAGKLTGHVLARARTAGASAALVAPTVRHAPSGVIVEQGGGIWDADELARRTVLALRRALRLPHP